MFNATSERYAWYNVREHNEPSGYEADIWRVCSNHDVCSTIMVCVTVSGGYRDEKDKFTNCGIKT